jgi:protein-S-isoprenylcysteine O-methyltransferase Ste14
MKGKILVTIQFTCIALLAITTNWFTLQWWAFLFIGLSGFLAFWAMKEMRFGNFNVVPYPVEKGKMVITGPYRFIRHPMYTSIFIYSAGLLTGQFDLIKLIISLILVADLILKMLFEEKLLCSHFAGYKTYMLKTKRVVPFVW